MQFSLQSLVILVWIITCKALVASSRQYRMLVWFTEKLTLTAKLKVSPTLSNPNPNIKLHFTNIPVCYTWFQWHCTPWLVRTVAQPAPPHRHTAPETSPHSLYHPCCSRHTVAHISTCEYTHHVAQILVPDSFYTQFTLHHVPFISSWKCFISISSSCVISVVLAAFQIALVVLWKETWRKTW